MVLEDKDGDSLSSLLLLEKEVEVRMTSRLIIQGIIAPSFSTFRIQERVVESVVSWIRLFSIKEIVSGR